MCKFHREIDYIEKFLNLHVMSIVAFICLFIFYITMVTFSRHMAILWGGGET